VKLGEGASDDGWLVNPYICGSDRIVLSFALISADMDVFSRLIPRLLALDTPIRKSEAVKAYADTISSLANEADSNHGMSGRQRDPIYRQLRELKKATTRSKPELWESSTAWHRASSRLEAYTDLGLLTKGPDESEKYAYIYRTAETMGAAAATLADAESGDRWLADSLVDVICGTAAGRSALTLDQLRSKLQQICSVLASPVSSVPITPLALWIARECYSQGSPITLGAAKESVLGLARYHPEVARLARGYAGSDAEFVSINLRSI